MFSCLHSSSAGVRASVGVVSEGSVFAAAVTHLGLPLFDLPLYTLPLGACQLLQDERWQW